MTSFWHRIPATQKYRSTISVPAKMSRFSQSPNEAGFYLGMAEEGRKIFVMGHPEYDRMTLDGEYHRDKDKGLPIEIPKNYYKNDDPNTKPVLLWRSHANNLYTNWLNYYVYQVTPYNLDGTPDFSGKIREKKAPPAPGAHRLRGVAVKICYKKRKAFPGLPFEIK